MGSCKEEEDISIHIHKKAVDECFVHSTFGARQRQCLIARPLQYVIVECFRSCPTISTIQVPKAKRKKVQSDVTFG